MPFEMANLKPDATGIGAYVHVFQDVDARAKHGPRIKVFPGRPREGNATTIAVPAHPSDKARVIGKATVRGKVLRRALRFVDLNWQTLALAWWSSEYSTQDLLAEMRPVK